MYAIINITVYIQNKSKIRSTLRYCPPYGAFLHFPTSTENKGVEVGA